MVVEVSIAALSWWPTTIRTTTANRLAGTWITAKKDSRKLKQRGAGALRTTQGNESSRSSVRAWPLFFPAALLILTPDDRHPPPKQNLEYEEPH